MNLTLNSNKSGTNKVDFKLNSTKIINNYMKKHD